MFIGFCLPFFSNGKFIESCERIKLPDDCTVGFISGKFIYTVTFDSLASSLQTQGLHRIQFVSVGALFALIHYLPSIFMQIKLL